MPCMDGGPSLEQIRAEKESRRIKDETAKEYPALKQRADKVTRLLCELLRNAEKNHWRFELTNELAKWWAEHKKEDEAREKRELAKKYKLKAEIQRNIDKLLNQLQELD
jgi:hypothetical protein